MQLSGKVAVVYGAAGAMGGAAARALGAAGARMVLVGRTVATLEVIARDIRDAGGEATTAVVDVDDPSAVEAHAAAVVAEAGGYDICFNAAGMDDVQNVALVDMTLDDFMLPIVESARRQFATATSAARRMIDRGSGVIVTFSTTAAREWRHQMGGFNVACAGIEALTRSLAGELGRHGIRVVCVRPNFTPETLPLPPDERAAFVGNELGQLVGDTALGRLPLLDEVAATVVYAASDAAGAMSGAVLNLSCGALVD